MNRTTPSTASERFSSTAWTPERRAAQAALMASLNANPEFAARRDAATAANRAANSARMVARHKDPQFAAAHSERSRARMAAMNSHPEFVARLMAAGGSLTSIIQAGASIPINISTAATTQLVAALIGKAIYVTVWDVIAAGTTNFTFEYGKGTNCAAGTTALTGPYGLVAWFGAAKGSGLGPVLVVQTDNALCVSSARSKVSGSLAFTQF